MVYGPLVGAPSTLGTVHLYVVEAVRRHSAATAPALFMNLSLSPVVGDGLGETLRIAVMVATSGVLVFIVEMDFHARLGTVNWLEDAIGGSASKRPSFRKTLVFGSATCNWNPLPLPLVRV